MEYLNFILIVIILFFELYLFMIIILAMKRTKYNIFKTAIKRKNRFEIFAYFVILPYFTITFIYDTKEIFENSITSNLVTILIIAFFCVILMRYISNSTEKSLELLKRWGLNKSNYIQFLPFLEIKNHNFDKLTFFYLEKIWGGKEMYNIISKLGYPNYGEGDLYVFSLDIEKGKNRHSPEEIELKSKKSKDGKIIHPLLEKMIPPEIKEKIFQGVILMDIKKVVFNNDKDGYIIYLSIKRETALSYPNELYDLLKVIKKDL